MPHVYCLRDPSLVKLHLLSDSVIALSYLLIPFALLLLVRRRRDLAFPWMFALFGIFILGCGLTHIMAVVTLWDPVYRLDGLIKAITAIASLLTAFLLFRLLPGIQALPSPAQLRVEIDQREQAEAALRQLNEHLEGRVNERTAELKVANEQLERAIRSVADSEERFRTLAEAVPDILWTRDVDGYNRYVSPRYEQFTGLPVADLLGFGWRRAVHPDDRLSIQNALRAAGQRAERYEVEYRLRRYDGVYSWFVARALPICDQDGRVTQWIGCSTEIDRLKRTEAALRRSNDELRQVAYVAAHDLQEPLRNVANAVGMLRRYYGEMFDQSSAKWLQASIEGAQRMQEMVQDLLTYSRVVEDAENPNQPVQAGKALASAQANLSAMVVETRAKISGTDLPTLEVKESHLVQLFQNLLSNALKFRRQGVAPEIDISAERNDTEWVFTVRDNGIGFAPEYSEKIFGVFKRLHLRQQYSGNGIGLAICARIVAHYGGRIWAESRPGEGARFHFTLPAR